jgi:hypothetical protein
VEGPAFSITFRLLSTVIVGGCGLWLWLLRREGSLTGLTTHANGTWILAALAVMLCTWWYILRSRTRIDTQGLQQFWLWNKHMAYDDLAYAKLIRVRGLDWLIAPRLYVRTLLGKFAVFYGATPELVADFERLARELRQLRQF